MTTPTTSRVTGSIALVTGANRGLGALVVDALLAHGATTVYAAARDVTSVAPRDGVVPVHLDLLDPGSVAVAAELASDVTLLVNNAGSDGKTSVLTSPLEDVRAEIEVNALGTLAVTRAFAPVIERNGGGTVATVLSALSWFSMPGLAGYSAAKAASWSMTNALRQELAPRGVRVLGLHVGYMDTDMASMVDGPKADPRDVADQLVAGIADGAYEVLADGTARGVKQGLSGDLTALYPGLPA